MIYYLNFILHRLILLLNLFIISFHLIIQFIKYNFHNYILFMNSFIYHLIHLKIVIIYLLFFLLFLMENQPIKLIYTLIIDEHYLKFLVTYQITQIHKIYLIHQELIYQYNEFHLILKVILKLLLFIKIIM